MQSETNIVRAHPNPGPDIVALARHLEAALANLEKRLRDAPVSRPIEPGLIRAALASRLDLEAPHPVPALARRPCPTPSNERRGCESSSKTHASRSTPTISNARSVLSLSADVMRSARLCGGLRAL